MNIEEVKKLNPQGFTIIKTQSGYRVAGFEDYCRGYAVSITNNVISDIESDFKALDKVIGYLSLSDNTKVGVGYWNDDVENKEYLDITLIVPDLDTAKLLAKIFKQKAIYSFDDHMVILGDENGIQHKETQK